MKRSLTTLCLLLCLAAAASAQQETNASANANANVGAGAANGVSPVTLVVQQGQTAKVEVGPQPEQPKGMDPLFKDRVDVISKLGTPISLIVAVILAWQQIKKNREERERNEAERGERRKRELDEQKKDREQSERNRLQREEELRWKKAQLAKELLDELYSDPYASDAMLMLDWSGRQFRVKANRNQPDGEMMPISWPDVWAALRITELNFSDKEKFIRDCFDAFFGYMQSIAHYIAIDLIDPADVRHPFDYYISSLDRNAFVFDNFIDVYHPRASDFRKRLRAMGRGEGDAPPEQEAEAAPPPETAYYIFDCPPREERFIIKLEDPENIKEARAVLTSEDEWHVSGRIIDAPVYYNAPWTFHVEPQSVNFPESDMQFAEDVNEYVERRLGKEKALFKPDRIWHTGGARLLAELPAWRFDEEQAMRRDEQQMTLRGQGRVAESSGAPGEAAPAGAVNGPPAG
jgi:hypothetical protein